MVPFESLGFLFAFHNNYGSILYHFRDKAENHIPLHSTLPLGRFTSEYCHAVWYEKKLEWCVYVKVKKVC